VLRDECEGVRVEGREGWVLGAGGQSKGYLGGFVGSGC